MSVQQKNKNTILVTGEFPPPSGGIAVQALAFCEHLRQENITVLVHRHNPAFPGLLKPFGNIKGLKTFLRFMLFKLGLPGKIFKADTLYLFSSSYLNYYLFTLPALVMGRLSGKNIILNYHGGAAQRFFNGKGGLAARWSLRLASHIFVPSPFLKGIFEQLGYTAVIVPNLLDLGKFAYREREGLMPRFLVARHLEPEYNTGMVLRAFQLIREQVPAAVLTVCGDGSQRKLLERESADLGIAEAVTFLGAVDNSRMPGIYGQSDILLNGSNIDNLPVAIMEAFACGLPVISTRAGGIPFMIEHEKNGLLVSLYDYRAMAECAVNLLNSGAKGARLAAAARGSLGQYTWPSIREILKGYIL